MRRAAFLTLALGALSVLALGLASCTRPVQFVSPKPAGLALQSVDPGPFVVIGHLEHRDRVITIKTGEQGPVYSGKNKDGQVLFENLTAEQLKTRSPEIHDFIEAATAGEARLRVPQPSMKIISR